MKLSNANLSKIRSESSYRPNTTRRSQNGSGIRALQRQDALRQTVVKNAQDWSTLDAPEGVTSNVSGRTLTVTYWRPEVVDDVAGTFVFDAFQVANPNTQAGLYVGADSITLRAPEDYQITQKPTGEAVSVNDTTAVWSGTDPYTTDHTPSIDYTEVTFSSDDATLPGFQSGLAMLVHDGPP